MMQLLTGPLLRQFIQLIAGVAAGTGFATETEVLTLIGAVGSVANIVWVIYARVTAGK